jgi:predicted Zn finger-like uncharacterized protein
MLVVITCSSCSERLKVSDQALGKRVRCPRCQEQIVAQLDVSSRWARCSR